MRSKITVLENEISTILLAMNTFFSYELSDLKDTRDTEDAVTDMTELKDLLFDVYNKIEVLYAKYFEKDE